MIAGNTRIYNVKMVDVSEGKEYSLAASMRDLYDTITEEGDNVKIYLESSGGFTKADSLVRVKSIGKFGTKLNSADTPVYTYKVTSLLGGLNEELTGNDTSIYCSHDTKFNIGGRIQYVRELSLSREYEVTKLYNPNADLYIIKLDHFSDGGNIIRTNVMINGMIVMI